MAFVSRKNMISATVMSAILLSSTSATESEAVIIKQEERPSGMTRQDHCNQELLKLKFAKLGLPLREGKNQIDSTPDDHEVERLQDLEQIQKNRWLEKFATKETNWGWLFHLILMLVLSAFAAYLLVQSVAQQYDQMVPENVCTTGKTHPLQSVLTMCGISLLMVTILILASLVWLVMAGASSKSYQHFLQLYHSSYGHREQIPDEQIGLIIQLSVAVFLIQILAIFCSVWFCQQHHQHLETAALTVGNCSAVAIGMFIIFHIIMYTWRCNFWVIGFEFEPDNVYGYRGVPI